jgi:hypothetical protein
LSSTTVSADRTVDFGDTGVEVSFTGTRGSGTVEVTKYDNPPAGTGSIGARNVSSYRFVAEVDGDLSIGSSTAIRIDVSSLKGVSDPSAVSIYRRSTPGQGTFSKLSTTYDASANDLVAEVSGFSEFALGDDTNPLPVELTEFDAQVDGSDIVLTWRTASETGNAGFEIQRRAGKTEWSTVGEVDGHGTTSTPQAYRFTDTEVQYAADSLSYRLKQIDTDGTVQFTDAVAVQRGAPDQIELLGTFPNPVRQQATVRYALPEQADVTIRLYDVLGRRVRTIIQEQQQGRQTLQLNVSDLSSGVYFLRLAVDGETKIQRLTVTH